MLFVQGRGRKNPQCEPMKIFKKKGAVSVLTVTPGVQYTAFYWLKLTITLYKNHFRPTLTCSSLNLPTRMVLPKGAVEHTRGRPSAVQLTPLYLDTTW